MPTFTLHNYARPATFWRAMQHSRLALLALVAIFAASCGGNDKNAASTTAPTTTATAPPPPSSGGGSIKPHGKGGQLLVNTRDLYPLLSGNIQSFAPAQVTGKAVPVLVAASPTSVWVGLNATHRLLLSIRLKGTNGPKLRRGQKIDFVGALLQLSGPQAGQFGLSDTDRAKLVQEGAYVDVSAADLHPHK